MRKGIFLLGSVITALLLVLGGCGKGDITGSISGIQTGDTTVGISAHYLYTNTAQVNHELIFKYNYALPTKIDVVVSFYLHGKGKKNIQFTIPAGNETPVSEINGSYLNNWIYAGGSRDSITGVYIPSVIDESWEVDSIKIVSVGTPNKQYGFKVIKDDESWPSYLEVKNLITSIQLTYRNGKEASKDVLFSGYDFQAGGTSYNMQYQNYGFYYFSFKFQMITGESTYPLKDGMTLDVPILLFWDGRQWGTEPDANPYSTVKLKIHNVSDSHFDGSFEGQLFSDKQPDTLFITKGEIINAILPTKE